MEIRGLRQEPRLPGYSARDLASAKVLLSRRNLPSTLNLIPPHKSSWNLSLSITIPILLSDSSQLAYCCVFALQASTEARLRCARLHIKCCLASSGCVPDETMLQVLGLIPLNMKTPIGVCYLCGFQMQVMVGGHLAHHRTAAPKACIPFTHQGQHLASFLQSCRGCVEWCLGPLRLAWTIPLRKIRLAACHKSLPVS